MCNVCMSFHIFCLYRLSHTIHYTSRWGSECLFYGNDDQLWLLLTFTLHSYRIFSFLFLFLSPPSILYLCQTIKMYIVYRYEIYTLQFKSDGVTRRMTIDGPQPDNWFAVAFISWTDPNNDRIEQQGNYYGFLIIFVDRGKMSLGEKVWRILFY